MKSLVRMAGGRRQDLQSRRHVSESFLDNMKKGEKLFVYFNSVNVETRRRMENR